MRLNGYADFGFQFALFFVSHVKEIIISQKSISAH